MSRTFNDILATADWKELTPRLLYYADNLIRQCVWLGLVVRADAGAKVCVEGFGADDFLQEAIDRLLNGQRTYNYAVSLEQNLRGVIRSIIWSLNKSSRRKGITQITSTLNSDEKSDPVDQLPSSMPSPEASIIATECAQEQERILKEFEGSLVGEHELLKVFSAYKTGRFKPRNIEKLTGIPAVRVSELKRKLRERMEQFEAQIALHQHE